MTAVTQGGSRSAVATLERVYDQIEAWAYGKGELLDWNATLDTFRSSLRRLESEAENSSAGQQAA